MKEKRLTKKRIEARAVLLDIKQTGIYSNRLAQVKLQMQVYPDIGRNFVTEVCEVVDHSDLKQLRIGDVMLVKYNPANTKEVLILIF